MRLLKKMNEVWVGDVTEFKVNSNDKKLMKGL